MSDACGRPGAPAAPPPSSVLPHHRGPELPPRCRATASIPHGQKLSKRKNRVKPPRIDSLSRVGRGRPAGSAATASKGDICWFAYTRLDAATNTSAVCGPSGNSGIVGPTSGPNVTSPNCYRYTAYDSSTTWPDTINNSTANAENNLRLCPTIKVA